MKSYNVIRGRCIVKTPHLIWFIQKTCTFIIQTSILKFLQGTLPYLKEFVNDLHIHKKYKPQEENKFKVVHNCYLRNCKYFIIINSVIMKLPHANSIYIIYSFHIYVKMLVSSIILCTNVLSEL